MINVLSLFDGMSGTQLALRKNGVVVGNYFASEVDKYAIKVTQANFPNTLQLGCVKHVQAEDLPEIDLMVGGSPCQGFSFAGKQLNFSDDRSKLLLEFVRLLNSVKPKYFLLENVKMKKEFQDVITMMVGVEPIEINSNLVSAQNRRRLYWTNIPQGHPLVDKGIMLKDIVLETTAFVDRDKAFPITGNIARTNEKMYTEQSRGQMVFDKVDRDKSHCIDANYWKGGNMKSYFEKHRRQLVFEKIQEYVVPFDRTLKILDKEVARGKVGYYRKDSQANRVYYIHDKAVTLCGDAGGGSAKMGQYLFGCITPSRVNKSQNGQRFSEGKKFYTLTAQDNHGILIEGYIRKLTPVECERLQTVPDGYTRHVSNTQRYKMLGNGFTVDVIAHLLKGAFNGELSEEESCHDCGERLLSYEDGVCNDCTEKREQEEIDDVSGT
jgi:DNA (cytosine-5)-methyltransferase 3A